MELNDCGNICNGILQEEFNLVNHGFDFQMLLCENKKIFIIFENNENFAEERC